MKHKALGMTRDCLYWFDQLRQISCDGVSRVSRQTNKQTNKHSIHLEEGHHRCKVSGGGRDEQRAGEVVLLHTEELRTELALLAVLLALLLQVLLVLLAVLAVI